jgi:heme-degrading monooxygenase HmoA
MRTMAGQILTDVSATVDADREAELVAGFRQMTAGGTPDGLVRTVLLSGPERQWRVQTLWRDRAALDAMRAGPEPPAAPRLFSQVGAEPSLQIYEVAYSYAPAE